MGGAVDLAAIKARTEAVARAAQAPPPAAGATVVAVDEASFQAEVLDRSFQVPVLIDLWAEWCQPCKQLSPLLEKLAAEGAGAWVLATIDVDANPRISQALQVQSIPTVFAVISGQVVPGFSGALPEAQLREFITALLEAAAQAGLSGGPAAAAPADVTAVESEPPADARFDAAEAFLEVGDYDAAARAFQAILDVEPLNAEAALALGQTHFLQRLADVEPDVLTRAAAAPADVAVQLRAADQELAADDTQAALDRLIALAARVRGDERDTVRNRLLEYFDLLGPEDDRVPVARRRLASALF